MISRFVKLRGITPLLQNRMSESVLEGLRTKTKPPKTASIGTTRTPREDAEPKVHVDAKGNPGVPALVMMSTLIAAGRFCRLDGKKQISTADSTVLPGFLSLEGSFFKLLNSEGKPATWEADVKQGRNPNGGEAVAICRPRFDEWNFSLRIAIADEEVGENIIRQLFDFAGRRVGIGDFRPARKGIFGQFVVDEWSAVEDKIAAE